MERIIEQTADGSATLFVPSLNEHYHSIKGAQSESQHIFIDMGLKESEATHPRILEIGFGTGLNALLTQRVAEASKRNVHYTTLELYPLAWEVVNQLGYVTPHTPEAAIFEQMHRTSWEKETTITPHFTLRKRVADVNEWATAQTTGKREADAEPEPHFDLIYFDAFAPEKQPEMWTQELFEQLYTRLNTGGILTTYCAKGEVRRRLQAAGFVVERLPGPPGGKREILRGTKQQSTTKEQ